MVRTDSQDQIKKEVEHMNLLLVIDLQNEFINENTLSAEEEIKKLVNSDKYDRVLFTRFINDENNPTFKKLNYKGCINDQSKEICIDTNENKVFDKRTYSAYNQELIDYISNNNIKNIYLCGIDIECCVLVTALNLFENNYNVFILKDYVYCTYGEQRKSNALEILKRNIGEENVI